MLPPTSIRYAINIPDKPETAKLASRIQFQTRRCLTVSSQSFLTIHRLKIYAPTVKIEIAKKSYSPRIFFPKRL